MRKVLGRISLLVLLLNTLLTPLTYAGEYEEILEISGENTAEEVVEEIGEEESSSEFSVEEENTDEENEEETAEGEEEGTEEEEEGEEGEEIENSTGDNVEDGTGEISEIGSGEIEGLTGETVEGETGDIVEVITGTTEELTGDVGESSGTGEETIVEEIKYNEEPIIGEETYDNVTVKVEALSGTFPEGTELVIEPIRYWNLVSLKRELVEERNEIGDDTTLVAFDITFRYEGEEVQPKEGEKVKVAFDYSKNEELVEADKQENQEVKVYHIEDKDEEGNKVEDEEKKIRDVTNVEESEEDGIAVADGKSFSIYAVLKTAIDATITYNLNGGYWTEGGIDSIGSKEIVYTLGNPVEYFKTPSKVGNTCEGKKCMFDGWYTDQEGTTKWNGDPSTATTVYAKWLPFEDLHTYLLINENNIIHKTLMDRNMGATKVYNNTNDNDTLGYQYQWGNNYGFPAEGDIKSYKYITVKGGRLSDNIWGKGVSSKYYRNYFDNTKDENWMDDSTTYNMKNVWGGAGDTCEAEGVGTTQENRQGPCPDGYHVPSIYEWGQVYSGWAKAVSKEISDQNNRNELSKDLLLPNNINRRKGGSFTNESKYVGINYASSSLGNDNKYYGIYITSHEAQLCGLTDNSNIEATSTSRPVRCFKNSENGSSYLSRIYLKGGTGGTISIVSGEVKALRDPKRGTDTFYGWYTTPNFSGSKITIGSGLQQGDSLYAKWCQDPLVDNGTNCVNAKTITFDTDGGSDVPTQYITPGGTGTRPADPEKYGYSFGGWYTDDSYATVFDFDIPIVSNIILYAKRNLIEYSIGYNLNDGELPVGLSNPLSYTIETNSFTLNNPTKDDYIFEGWSGTNLPECTMENTLNCEKNVTITQGSTGDRSYEAIWGYIKYDLIFDSIGGSEVESQIVIKGRTGTRPLDPEKDGYTFVGWYTDNTYATGFDFETAITSNITVYAKWNLIDYHITYNLNGGTGLANTGIYTIETDSFTLNSPSKLNYEFIGWSGTNLSGCSVENQTTCNTTVTVEQGSVGNRVYEAIYDCAYGRKLDGTCNIAKGEDGLIDYDNWEYNDLEVDLSVTEPVKIVIMDRNLGAAASGVEENAYGFYYQWGNNYGFRNVIEKTSTEQVDASAYGPENYYISDTFILQDSLGWDAPVNYNLWGGTGDTTSKRGDGDDEARQGPCPLGYHVPSILEWHKLNSFADTWRNSKNATDVCSEFNDNRQCVLSKFLKIPRAGNILGKDGSFQPYDGGYLGRYWSSSRHNDNRAYRYRINGNWDIYQGLSNNTDNYSYYNSQGMSVRCFKNVSSKPIVYELSGGVQTSNQTSTVVWWNESAGKTLTIPTKTGFVFEGWYLTSGYEKGTRVTKNVISDYSDNESVILYANWKNPEYKTIIYNANGGYFSGGLLSTGIVFKEHTVSGNYMALTNVQFPNREGYMFDGWYLTGGETEWTGYVNNSTEEQTVYAKWLSFDDLTVTMSGITFTLMDRNLGATDFATGYTYGSDNEQNNQSRRGKYYQWGNNYGFSDSGNSSSSNKINNTDNFGPGNYFSNAVYIWNGRVWGNAHNDLWGGQYQSSGDETRQGPCPVNYHVPTKDEWDRSLALFNVWKHTEEGITYCNSLVNSGDMYCFSAKLGLPFAGYLEGANNLREKGAFGTYWSSTKSGYTDPYRLRLGNMRTETLSNGYGNSIRCFKDTQKRELIFDSKGGSKIDFMQTVRWWESTSSLPTPTRSNSTFTGWYMTSGYEEGTKVSVNYIGTGLGPVTLYAKWECNEGYEESEDGNSCTSFGYTITYDSTTNGGTKEEQTEGVEYGAHPSLSLYTGYKEGWTFVGWNTNSGATYGLNSDEITITSDIILYAIYRKEAKILEIVSYPLNGDGITYNEGHDYGFSCTLPEVFNNEEQDTSCTVSMPFVTINDWSRREFIGVNSDSGATENASNIVWETYDYEISGFKTPVYSGTITLTEETSGKKWYIISKYPSITLTGNFQENGSTILGETSTGCTIGEIYNKAQEITSCEVDMPRVTPNTDTPTFVGWNTNSGATENDGVSYNNITNKLTLSLANGEEQDWYAITKSSEIQAKLYMHLNGNSSMPGGTVFGVWSYNDTSNLSDVKVIFNLCKIPSSYNGVQQSPYCTQDGTMFSFTPYGTKTAIGWSAASGTGSEIIYTPGQTNVTLTGYKTNPEVHLYAQSVLTGSSYSVIFSGNGAKMGTSESDEITLTCRGENSYNGEEETKSKECNVITPSIIREGYTIQGYTGDNDYEVENPNLITGGSSLKLSSINNGNTYYVSSYKPATIIFDKNGNAAQIKSGLVVETIEDVVEICNIWNRKENCRITIPEIIPAVGKAVKGYSTSGTTYENEIAHKALIDVTESGKYYAWSEYSPVKYTANFEIGTGVEPIVETSGSCMTEVKYNSEEIESSCKVQLPELTAQVGYTNPKWYSGDVEVVLDGERKTTISGDVEFTAKAETHKFTVAITVNNDDYGRVTSGLVEAQEGVEITTSGNELTIGDEKVIAIVTGDTAQYSYEFSGWNNNCGNVLSGDCTIEVEFERKINTYTVTFDANSGDVSETPRQVTFDEEYGVLPVATRTGYTFQGWYTEKDGGDNITGTTKVTIASNHTLYAHWSENLYTIEFNENGGQGPMSPMTNVKYTDEVSLTANTFTRDGYQFNGWSITSDGAKVYDDKQKVSKLTGENNATVTLYAVWQKGAYNITYDFNGGALTGGKTNPVGYDVDTETFILNNPERDGYDFLGWSGTEIGGLSGEVTIAKGSIGDREYEANWKVKTYTITYDLKGGELPSGKTNPEEYTIESLNFTFVNPTREGYDFLGWSGTEIDGLSTQVIIANGSTGDRKYEANWKIRTYTITWKNSTGTVLETDENVPYGTMPSYDGLEPTSGGNVQYTYTFSGWTPATGMVVGNQVYTATYTSTVNKYAITFVDEDGTELKAAKEYEYNTSAENIVKPADPIKEADAQYSYSFIGWDPEVHNVTGAQVYTATYDRTINKYSVFWKNRDGDVLETDENVEYGSKPKYDGNTPLSGETVEYQYRFAGWDPSITNETIIEGDTVYTATYEPIKRKYQIIWKDYDDQIIDTTEVEYGVIPTHVNPIRTGHEFNTWDPIPVEVTGSTSYKATYTIKQYTVTPEKGVGVADILGGGTYDYGTEIILTGIAKEGYHFEGGVTIKEFNVEVPAKNITVRITAQPNTYYVHFKNNGGEGVMNDQEFTYDQEQALISNAYTRNGFTFVSWTDGEGGIYKDKAVVKNLATSGTINLIAQWIEGDVPGPIPPSPAPSGGGGGGGGGKFIDDKKDDKQHDSAEDKQQEKEIKDDQTKRDQIIKTGEDINQLTGDSSVIIPEPIYNWTEEELTAYKFAYKYGITTLAPEYAAMPDEYVVRGHMAKMVVNYALNVLHRKLPDKLPKQCKWKDGANAWESKEIKDYAEKACALGIMGIDMNYFQPKKYVTRAQFGTIIGRLLRGKLVSKPYYAAHLRRLNERGIMTQIENPENRIEIRKRAWLMFMRMEKYQ